MKHVAESAAEPDRERRRAPGPRRDASETAGEHDRSRAGPLGARTLQGLQQTAGNSAVAALLNGRRKRAGTGSAASASTTQTAPPQGPSEVVGVAERRQVAAVRNETAADEAKSGERRVKAQTAEAETAAQAGAVQAEEVAAQGAAGPDVEVAAEEGGQAEAEAAAVYEAATGGDRRRAGGRGRLGRHRPSRDGKRGSGQRTSRRR